MSSRHESPERIMSSPSRESTPEPATTTSESVKVDELDVTEPIKHNRLTTHPFLTDEKLIETTGQLHTECLEITKNMAKKRSEWREAMEEHKKKKIMYVTDDLKLKGEREEYEKKNVAFIKLRDTELKSMWAKRSFKPGQRSGSAKTFGDYDRSRLMKMLDEDDAVVEMHEKLSGHTEENGKMKMELDELKEKQNIASRELRDVASSYRQAYQKLGKLVEQVISNMLDADDDDEDAPEVKRPRFEDQIDCHPSKSASPAKNGASGGAVQKENDKKRK